MRKITKAEGETWLALAREHGFGSDEGRFTLGRFIVDGLDQQDYTKAAAGAVLVAVLALATEVSLAGVERILVPRGLRLQQRPVRQRAATFKTA